MDICGIPSNLNGRNCQDAYISQPVGLMLIPAGTGEVSFATKSAMTSQLVVAAINNVNPLVRILPMNNLDNYDPMEGDPITKEFDSGLIIFIERGITTIKGVKTDADNTTVEAFLDLNNLNMGAWLIDNDKFQYATDSATKMMVKGIKVAKGSFKAKLIPGKKGEVESMEYSFNIDKSFDTRLLRTVSNQEMGYSLADICEPLITIGQAIVSAPTTTSHVVTVYDDRGKAISGLVTANFACANMTVPATVTITVSESLTVKGQYTIAHPSGVLASQVLNDTITATGFDSYFLPTIVVTIPS